MARHVDTLQELRAPTRSLRHAIPATWAGFTSLHDAAMADGEVPARLKEAVALAISVVKRCDGCIAHHAKAAARAGATPGEVAELLGVALLMDGGTASVYAPRAWEAFDEFRASTGGESRREGPSAAAGAGVSGRPGGNGDHGPPTG
jgi:AhpD family alkylhydroperoxidase